MFIVAVLFAVFINNIQRVKLNSIQNHLLVAAQRASTYLTVDELDLFHTEEDMLRPEWEEIRTKLQRFAEETSVLYVYYWRYDGDNHIQYIIDNDEDEEYMVTPAMFFALDSDEISGEAALIIEAGESWVTELGIYTNSWDGLLTAVVPVFNQDGTVYCGAGVDISDEILITMRNNIRIMRFALICSLVVSIFSGFFGMRSYNKKAIQSANDSLSKSQFLSTMSHEIRTPMNAILGIAEIHLRSSELSDEVSEGFLMIYESGSLLLNIINDILDLSKIEAGKLEIYSERYDIPSLVNDIAQINRVKYENKQIEFKLTLDENTPDELIGDQFRIKQILNNILSNAYKYTESGEICMSVSAEYEDDSENALLIFEISDTGQGMTEQQIKRLFDEYQRFNTEVNRDIIGAGLGMNITKRLVEMMNGRIVVKSVFQEGSVFTVYLPQKRFGKEKCGAEISERMKSYRFGDRLISKITKMTCYQMPDCRVLVVDDVYANLFVAQGMLLPYGLNVETANSGFEAIEKIKQNREYDIIFMDHMMPKMDGIEAAKIIREMGYTNPIIALTANAIVGQEEIFLANGFDAFLAKPIDSHILDNLLIKLIKNKKVLINKDERKGTLDYDKIKKIIELDAVNTINILKEMTDRLENLNDNELKSYTIAVHGMKSALTSIGEKDLSGTARKLEQAGNDKNFAMIASDTPAFIDALVLLAEKYKTPETNKNTVITEKDLIYLQEKMKEIKIACENFNIIAAKTTLADVKHKTWPCEINNICEEISIALLRGEFKIALAAVDKILNTDSPAGS